MTAMTGESSASSRLPHPHPPTAAVSGRRSARGLPPWRGGAAPTHMSASESWSSTASCVHAPRACSVCVRRGEEGKGIHADKSKDKRALAVIRHKDPQASASHHTKKGPPTSRRGSATAAGTGAVAAASAASWGRAAATRAVMAAARAPVGAAAWATRVLRPGEGAGWVRYLSFSRKPWPAEGESSAPVGEDLLGGLGDGGPGGSGGQLAVHKRGRGGDRARQVQVRRVVQVSAAGRRTACGRDG